jgi:hypothetical protein
MWTPNLINNKPQNLERDLRHRLLEICKCGNFNETHLIFRKYKGFLNL